VLSWSHLVTTLKALSCAAANGHEMIVQYLLHKDVSTSGGYHKCNCDLKVTTFIYVLLIMNHSLVVVHIIEINQKFHKIL